jgi:tRNA-Thr(GGU) m(6)t(6)A37 methyltransferase TsaA
MDIISLQPVAIVSNSRKLPIDDYWGGIISEITLLPHIPERAFAHIEDFSHLEILFFFNQVHKNDVLFSGRPRGNPAYPEVGIFAQRKKDRPNQLGLCKVELLQHTGRSIKVRNLDALNGTPILDIKPIFNEFEVRKEIRQPYWVSDLMKDYWKPRPVND